LTPLFIQSSDKMRALLLIFLLAAVSLKGIGAFVYTCNEISNTLLPQKLAIPSKYACVVLQDVLPPSTPWLSTVFVTDEASGKQYSLSSFSSLPSQPCITGDGPWRLIADFPNDIDCTYEVTLLFSSTPTNLIVIQPHAYEKMAGPGADLTFVSPRGGINLNWHYMGEVTGFEQINFYSGVGAGPEEDLYPIGSIFTNDFAEGRDTDIFDPVVTVKVPSNVTVEIVYTTFADKALNVFGYPGYSVTVMSSGRATTFQEQNTMKVVQAQYGRPTSVHVTASIKFDSGNDHKLKLQAFCGEDKCAERIITKSTEIDWMLNAEKFRVNYVTGLNTTQIGKNSDNVVISVVSSRSRCDDDFYQLGDHCYQISDSSSTFAAAEESCVLKGGHLASIHSEDTNTLIQYLAVNAPIGVFIGLRKENGQKFKWIDGTPLDYNNGHLDEFGGDCSIMGTFTGTWSNSDCDLAFRCVCEKN
ncbi:hypothetical protein PFISCL1PPCAC_5478, partial [Pristionchus fissidentatus]